MRIRRTLARAYWAVSRWHRRGQRLSPDGAGILLGAPHTSYWDFLLMLGLAWDQELPIRFLGKHTLFRWPAGPILKAVGGIPVYRANPEGLVDELIARLSSGERFYLVITPEGTRRGSGWKSGFYRIASATGLPVTLGYVDRTTMTTGLGPTIDLTGDVRADMDVIRAFYADKAGLVPSRRTEPRLRSEASASEGPEGVDIDSGIDRSGDA
jgi:1-acyl-sn-glycerol-3-phosphate acyltransferase